MKYKRVVVTKLGGPEVLRVVEEDLREPYKGEARIKIISAAVCRPDVTLRTGEALYTGTPLGRKLPFTPGYAIIGMVEAIGDDVHNVAAGDRVCALIITGGYSEYLYIKSNRLIPVPQELDPSEAVTLILNYIVAYQTLHRSAKVKAGEKALIIGASGGIGTALLQLGRLAGLQMYGMASKSKHAILIEYGATPIDYRSQDFTEVIRPLEPDGIDVVLDGMMRPDMMKRACSLLKRGGRMVSFGEPAGGLPALLRIFGLFLTFNLLPNGKSLKLYGTSAFSVGSDQPLRDDLAILFKLLAEGKIKPIIEKKFPILEAAQANVLLESGKVIGNVVLVSPEWL